MLVVSVMQSISTSTRSILVSVALAITWLAAACSSGGRLASGMGGAAGGGSGGAAGGGSGGTAGSGAAGNPCSERGPLWPLLQAQTLGPVPVANTGDAYNGPAVVERSTADEMVLFLALSGTDATNDPAGEFHITLSGWSDLPMLPLGASVWLSKHPLANPAPSFLPQTYSFEVRAAEGGTLILATSTAGAASPLSVSNRTVTCVGPGAGCNNGTTTYYSVDVAGDAPVTIDNAISVVAIGGRAYDVHVSSFDEHPSSHNCEDYFPMVGTSMDARLQDVTGLSLPAGTLPACLSGNDRTPFLALASSGRAYDGAVTYIGRDSMGELQFGAGQGFTLTIYDFGSLLAEPAVGQALWFTQQTLVSMLRASQDGELIVAEIPLANASAASTAPILGIGLSSARGCAYSTDASGNITYLTDAVFDGSPSVRLAPGTVGTVQIAGQPYHAMNRGGADVAIWK